MGVGWGGEKNDVLGWRILGPFFNCISLLSPPLYATVWLPLPAPPNPRFSQPPRSRSRWQSEVTIASSLPGIDSGCLGTPTSSGAPSTINPSAPG